MQFWIHKIRLQLLLLYSDQFDCLWNVFWYNYHVGDQKIFKIFSKDAPHYIWFCMRSQLLNRNRFQLRKFLPHVYVMCHVCCWCWCWCRCLRHKYEITVTQHAPACVYVVGAGYLSYCDRFKATDKMVKRNMHKSIIQMRWWIRAVMFCDLIRHTHRFELGVWWSYSPNTFIRHTGQCQLFNNQLFWIFLFFWQRLVAVIGLLGEMLSVKSTVGDRKSLRIFVRCQMNS